MIQLRQYKIAALSLSLFGNIALPFWERFAISECKIPDLEITILPQNYGKYGMEKFILEGEEVLCFRHEAEVMFTDQNWKKIQILPPVNRDHIDAFLVQIFHTHALRRRMIQLHCSTVDAEGWGILFLGPSGIGKTTQAELWHTYRGAKIINGDIGFVQETKDAFLAWGTPWHGSSPYCENTFVPIRAMVVLKQAQTNHIRKLEGFEKVKEVSDSVFYPTWLENGMDLCLSVLDQLLCHIPVYELSCRPDEEAVRITEEVIWNG